MGLDNSKTDRLDYCINNAISSRSINTDRVFDNNILYLRYLPRS